jgi:hypothetical protein
LPTQWLKRRPKLRVHRPEPADVSSDDEADQILDKVNRTGIQSLTRREREILEDYSRRMREKRR